VKLALELKLSEPLYNVGSGIDISIKDLALIIQSVIEHKGRIIWDDSKPDGTPRKLMDNSKILEKGWEPKTSLIEGVKSVYKWYLKEKYESILE